MAAARAAADTVLTVAELTARIRGALEDRFRSVEVEGEITGWTAAASGHAYFTIKDEAAALSCVMWRTARQSLGFDPRDGDMVRCRGAVTVYEKRGAYQLQVARMTRAGEGELMRRFLELKARLEAEGLFDPARKRPLPPLPRAVGVVTSPTGAVIHDIANVLRRRAPWLPVKLWPARVQGPGAAAEIARGVAALGRSGLVDLLIVGRGGGSLEDLWEFNSEAVARALRACPVPVVSAVGHETDFTICDFAADLRAPTPSAAAEVVSEGHAELGGRVGRALRTLDREVPGRLAERRRRVEAHLASHALRRPETMLRERQQRADLALRALGQAVDGRLEAARRRAVSAQGALAGHNPELVLARGWSIVRRARDGSIVDSPARVREGELLRVETKGGEFDARRAAENSQPGLFD
ncbi:MAG: exodeoxyribonuclease VII large subunit [Candidatus Sumerlaeia bacterium]|nr:exodeoxyribonuclease VII large subunit [Candidatus Sumerlaeia bacterium]